MMPQPELLDDLLDAQGEHPVTRPERPHTPSLAPRRRQPRPPRAVRIYQRGRGAVGLSCIALLFALAWLLNGYFTALAVVTLGGDWVIGVSVHLLITAVELTTVFVAPALRAVQAPGAVVLVIWLIVLAVGTGDTLSSALGLTAWGLALGLPDGLFLTIGSTLLAEMIAFLPEPMLVWIIAALVRVLKA
jgi:hypothetical protein